MVLSTIQKMEKMYLRNFLRGIFLAVFVVIGGHVFGQSVVHNQAWYEQFTYQWRENGPNTTSTEHTSNISEKATNPHQIIALLKKIYCDGNIPGPLYTGWNPQGNTRENEVYYGRIDGGWGISDSDVTAPSASNEGYTVLLVGVKNPVVKQSTGNNPSYFSTYDQLATYIGNNVSSVELLTDGMRIGDAANFESGTVFNVSGTYNRFFFISKGQSRKAQVNSTFNGQSYPYEQVPFCQMFEQMSPHSGAQGTDEITDFYQKMDAGEMYPVQHDCTSVIENDHYFCMSGIGGTEEKSLTGLNIFVPDYRLMRSGGSSEATDMNSSGNNWWARYAMYNTNHRPETRLYNIKLETSVDFSDREGFCNVTLTWTSSLDEMAGRPVPQDYYVYIYLIDPETGEEHRVYLDGITPDADHPTHGVTYTYEVPQEMSSYVLKYIVSGQPNESGSNYKFHVTFSNEAEAVIPGLDKLEGMELSINGHYESTYYSNDQKNRYNNYINLSNGMVYKTKTVHLNGTQNQQGTSVFTLYRFDRNDENNKTKVGTVTITKQYRGRNGQQYNYELNYQIAYESASQRTSNLVAYPTRSGKLQGTREYTSGWGWGSTTYRNLFDIQDEVNFDGIMFCDQFEASTADNDHPDHYNYKIVFQSNVDFDDDGTNPDEIHSNVVEIPVFKSEIEVGGLYTLEDVESDVDRHLTANAGNAQIMTMVQDSRNVVKYELARGLNGAAPNVNAPVALAQRTQDGNYQVREQSPESADWVDADSYSFADGQTNMFVPLTDRKVVNGQSATYVPVISVNKPDGSDGFNTYGADRKATAVGSVSGSIPGFEMSTYTWTDPADQVECCYYNVTIPIDADVPDGYSVAKYRVWRLCPDPREQLEDHQFRMSTDYMFEDYDSNSTQFYAGENDVNYPEGVQARPGEVSGTFGSFKVAEGKPLVVPFKVRLYYKKDMNQPSGQGIRRRANTNDDSKLYYVVEQDLLLNIQYSPDLPTSIFQVTAKQAPVQSVTYYSPAGSMSMHPHQGMNIVVTQYTDGTRKVEKKNF